MGVIPLPAAKRTMFLCAFSSKQNRPDGPDASTVRPIAARSFRKGETQPWGCSLTVISTKPVCVGDEDME
jgi:hypothetical protein